MVKLNKKFCDVKAVTTQGIIHVHPKGFAFVSPDDSEKFPEDVFIPKHLKGNAVDRDHVEIVISSERKPDKGPEGYVSKILERAKEELVGVVWIIKSKGDYLLYIQSLGQSKTAIVKKEKNCKTIIGSIPKP